MSLYFESHVTIEPVGWDDPRRPRLEELCLKHGFRVAKLLMQKRTTDTPERSRFDTFCTSSSVDPTVLYRRMLDLVAACARDGFKVWRYKIENVVIDSRVDDSSHRLK